MSTQNFSHFIQIVWVNGTSENLFISWAGNEEGINLFSGKTSGISPLWAGLTIDQVLDFSVMPANGSNSHPQLRFEGKDVNAAESIQCKRYKSDSEWEETHYVLSDEAEPPFCYHLVLKHDPSEGIVIVGTVEIEIKNFA